MEKLPGVVWDVSHNDVEAAAIHRHRQAVEAAHEHYLLGATADVAQVDAGGPGERAGDS